jgi:hypothetical protein
MKLRPAMDILAESALRPASRGSTDPLLTLHYKNVSDKVRAVRTDGDKIVNTRQASRVPLSGDLKYYETVLYHGITNAPEKKTFVRTHSDGNKEEWTEPLQW